MAVDIKQKVKQANIKFYDSIRNDYEAIDGRRREDLLLWLKERLAYIKELSSASDRLLDIGCGSGFVARAAKGLFKDIYGMDISLNILKSAANFYDGAICADSEFIPFSDNSIDTVVLFSAMHHFYDYSETLKEIHRVLKKGGVLYIDHDINSNFARRFLFLLWLYRKINRKNKRLSQKGIPLDLYELSEFHSDGIDSLGLVSFLKGLGFIIIKEAYHWFGLSYLTNKLFKDKEYKKSVNAPLLSIIAKKC